ncbi:hypothetical protein O6H91_17G045300 [Diphasiastrum complanatum]|uniref:Uncharacterized protein n=1 Tax=Diphasiastrum complanatum TaxID=34168 RepID=A0ACC2B6C7_DIPCM|nr:hypothetical protein O6H91_17G045300 [Diphasiastrum complanatum]
MKSSWKKLRDLANHRVKERTGSNNAELTQDLEDVTKCMENVQKMRIYYEQLHKVSSSVASRSHGFSEAVKGMGKLFVNTYALIEDGEIGNIFRMVGKVQIEVAKLFDTYATHVSELISIPAENLLNELQVVEEAKSKYDDKRAFHDHLSSRLTKGRLKTGKSEIYAEQQLQTAKEQYEELAKIVDSSVLLLEQRHRHMLISKASCHHTVQLHLFRKAFATLNKIEPYLDLVAQEINFDRRVQFEDRQSNESGNEIDSNEHDTSNMDEHEEFASPSSLDQVVADSHTDLLAVLTFIIMKAASVEQGTELESSASHLEFEKSISGYTSLARLSQADGAVVSLEHFAEKQPKTVVAFTSLSDKPQEPPVSLPQNATRTTTYRENSTSTNVALIPHEVKSVNAKRLTLQKGFLKEDWNARVSSERHSQSTSPTREQDHAGFSESKGHPLAPRNMDNASTPVTAFPTLQRPFSFRADGPNNAQSLKSVDSSSGQGFNKIHSQSGPLTFMGNPWHGRGSVLNRSPWSSKPHPHLEPVFKSGPLGESCLGRPFISPIRSPNISSPRICELHKLPPPPTDNTPDRYAISGLVSESRLSSMNYQNSHASANVSPLPLPPSEPITRTSSPYLADRTIYKPHHSKSSRYAMYPQIIEPEDEEFSSSPPLQPLSFKADNSGAVYGLKEYS